VAAKPTVAVAGGSAKPSTAGKPNAQQAAAAPEAKAARGVDEDEEPEPENEGEGMSVEQQTANMTATEKRLFLLRLQINKGRKANKAEATHEYKRGQDPSYEARRRKQEKKEEAQRAVVARLRTGSGAGAGAGDGGGEPNTNPHTWGARADTAELGITAAEAEQLAAKLAAKDLARQTHGLAADVRDKKFAAYEKQLAKLPSGLSGAGAGVSAGGAGGSQALSGFLAATSQPVSAHGAERVSADVSARDLQFAQTRQKRATAHVDADASNVDSINPSNAAFNKRLKTSFDKYTLDIRQNLERGTAL